MKKSGLLSAVQKAIPAHEEPAAQASPPPAKKARQGTKMIGGHFSPAVAKQLRHIAVEDDTTVQALLEEALDLLFAKKGKRHVRDLD